jgi:hypothetical protein
MSKLCEWIASDCKLTPPPSLEAVFAVVNQLRILCDCALHVVVREVFVHRSPWLLPLPSAEHRASASSLMLVRPLPPMHVCRCTCAACVCACPVCARVCVARVQALRPLTTLHERIVKCFELLLEVVQLPSYK